LQRRTWGILRGEKDGRNVLGGESTKKYTKTKGRRDNTNKREGRKGKGEP